MSKWIKLSEYAKLYNITYKTAHTHFKTDKIGFETKRLKSGLAKYR